MLGVNKIYAHKTSVDAAIHVLATLKSNIESAEYRVVWVSKKNPKNAFSVDTISIKTNDINDWSELNAK